MINLVVKTERRTYNATSSRAKVTITSWIHEVIVILTREDGIAIT